MDWLVKYVTPRHLMLLILLCMAAAFAFQFRGYPLQRYHQWRYPPQKGRTAQGEEILDSIEKQQSNRLRRKYERILTILSLSRAEGFEISDLEISAREALKLNVPGQRAKAEEMLYRIELDIPRKKSQYIPVEAPRLEIEPEERPAPEAESVKRRRSRHSRARSP